MKKWLILHFGNSFENPDEPSLVDFGGSFWRLTRACGTNKYYPLSSLLGWGHHGVAIVSGGVG